MDAQTTTPGGDRASAKHRADAELSKQYTTTGPVDKLLDRLEGVRATGRDQWVACCPSHDDRSPSLSIKATDDRVLVYCHAGCGAADVVAAVGLELRDLFDAPLSHHKPARRRPRVPAHKVLAAVSHALSVVALADADIRDGRLLTNDDWQAVDKARAIIGQWRAQR